jgi:hypothetical protein
MVAPESPRKIPGNGGGPADAMPLGTIRSLAYFLPVIEEVLGMRVSPEYFQHVRRKLERIASNR